MTISATSATGKPTPNDTLSSTLQTITRPHRAISKTTCLIHARSLLPHCVLATSLSSRKTNAFQLMSSSFEHLTVQGPASSVQIN